MADSSGRKMDPNRSLVNRCLVRLQQQQQNQSLPNVERLAESFKIYDELCEHLGVFKEVFRLLESEVYECVYSSEHLTATASEGTKQSAAIKRIPYFVLHHKLLTERDLKRDELQQQVDELKSTLQEKEAYVESLHSRLEEMESELREKMSVVAALDLAIKNQNSEIQTLNETIHREQQTAEQNRQEFELALKEVTDELTYTKEDRDEIAKFKTSYENLDYAFQVTVDEQTEVEKRKTKPTMATKEAYLLNDIMHARKLEEQLLIVQNQIIEENEKFTQNFEKKLSQFVPDLPETDYRYSLQLMEIQKTNEEAALTKERYLESLAQIEKELRYIRKHSTMLEEQLNQEDERKRSAQLSDPRLKKNVQFDADSSTDDGKLSVNPFTVNERVFSKYSCVVSFSLDGGKSYYDLDSTGYCRSCSEKTTVCAHRMIQAETVVALQPSTTHLKFIRPVVSINKELVDRMIGLPSLKGAQLQFLETVGEEKADSALQTQTLTVGNGQLGDEGGERQLTQTEYSAVAPKKTSLVRLIEDYQARTATDRYVPLRLALPRLMSVVESFLAELLLDDVAEEYQSLPILDHFYVFMMHRYLDRHVSYLATYDFVSSLLELAKTNQYCCLFAHVLVGNLDGAVLRYLTLLADLVQRVRWTCTPDARLFFQLIYPFLGDEELDALLLTYTGYAENKISARLVYEFTLYSILKERESRFVEIQSLLVQYLDSLSNNRMKDGGVSTETFMSMDDDDPVAGRRVMLTPFADYYESTHVTGASYQLAKRLFAETEIATMIANTPQTQANAILNFLKVSGSSQPFEHSLMSMQQEKQAAASNGGHVFDLHSAQMSIREIMGGSQLHERQPQYAALAAQIKPTGISVSHASQIIGYLQLLSMFEDLMKDPNGKMEKLRAAKLEESDSHSTRPATTIKSQRLSELHSKRSSARSAFSEAQRSEVLSDEHGRSNQDRITLIPYTKITVLGKNIVLANQIRKMTPGNADSDYEE